MGYYVYVFSHEGAVGVEDLYVGSTTNFIRRMKNHLNKGHLPAECYNRTTRIDVAFFQSEMEMRLAEIKLINEYRPEYNTKDLSVMPESGINYSSGLNWFSLDNGFSDVDNPLYKTFFSYVDLQVSKLEVLEEISSISRNSLHTYSANKEIDLLSMFNSLNVVVSKEAGVLSAMVTNRGWDYKAIFNNCLNTQETMRIKKAWSLAKRDTRSGVEPT